MAVDFVTRWNRAAAAERAEKFRESESARDIERERLAQERRKRGDALTRFQVLHSLATPLHIAGIYDDDDALAELMHNIKTTASEAGLQYELENPRAVADLGASDHMFKVVTEAAKAVQGMSAESREQYIDSVTDRLMSGPYGTVYLWRVAQDNLGAGAGVPEEEAAPPTPTVPPSPPAAGEVTPSVAEPTGVPIAAAPEAVPTGPTDARGQIRALVSGMLGTPSLSPEQVRLGYTQVTRPGLEALRRQPGADPAVVERSLASAAEEAVRGGLYPDVQTARAAIEAETAPVEDAYTAWVRQLGPEGLTPQGTPKQPGEFTDPFHQSVAVYIQRFGLAKYDETTGQWDFSAAVDEAQYDVKEEQRTADAAERLRIARENLKARFAQLNISQQTADRLDATAQRAINAITRGDPREARTALRDYGREYRSVDRMDWGKDAAGKERALEQIEELMIPLEEFLSGMVDDGTETDTEIDAILEGVGLQ